MLGDLHKGQILALTWPPSLKAKRTEHGNDARLYATIMGHYENDIMARNNVISCLLVLSLVSEIVKIVAVTINDRWPSQSRSHSRIIHVALLIDAHIKAYFAWGDIFQETKVFAISQKIIKLISGFKHHHVFSIYFSNFPIVNIAAIV